VANLAIWREPVTKRKKMTPDHVTLSPSRHYTQRKPPWMMKTTPVLTCSLYHESTQNVPRVPSEPLSLRILGPPIAALSIGSSLFLFSCNASLFETNDSTPVRVILFEIYDHSIVFKSHLLLGINQEKKSAQRLYLIVELKETS